MTLLTAIINSAQTLDGFTVSILAFFGSLVALYVLMRNSLKRK